MRGVWFVKIEGEQSKSCGGVVVGNDDDGWQI